MLHLPGMDAVYSCPAVKQEQEEEHKQRKCELETRILHARAQAQQNLLRSERLRRRLDQAATALLTVQLDLRTHPHADSNTPSPLCPPPRDSPLGSRPTPSLEAPLRWKSLSDPSDKCTAARVHSGPSAAAQPAFKHHVLVSVHDIRDPTSMLDELAAFRARTARELRCEMEHICWSFVSERHPELTQGGGISSHLGTAACTAKLSCLWHVTILELSASLAALKRLEATRCDYGSVSSAISEVCNSPRNETKYTPSVNAQSSTSTQFTQGASDAPPPGQDAASCLFCAPSHSNDNWSWELWASQHFENDAESNATRGALRARHAQVDAPAGSDPTPSLEDAIRGAVRRVLRRQLGQLHPADAFRMLRRARAFCGRQPPPPRVSEQDMTGPDALTFVLQLLKQELDAVTPASPAQWTSPSREHLDNEVAAISREMAACNAEWMLVWFLVQTDRPRFFFSMTQGVGAAVAGFQQFEEVNLDVYKALELSQAQKHSIATAARSYHRQVAALNALKASALSKLDQLTSDNVHAVESFMCSLRAAKWDDHAPQLCSQRSTKLHAHEGGVEEGLGCDVLHAAEGEEEWGEEGKAQRFVGASPTATDAVAGVLQGLRQVQALRNELLLRLYCEVRLSTLSSKQRTLWMTGPLPFRADILRIAGMAATDVCCERVYGRRSLMAKGHAPASVRF